MKMIFSGKDLSEIFNQNILHDIYDICIDSKDAKAGDLFVALKGERKDAHDFVTEAIQNGSTLTIVEKRIANVSDDKQVIVKSSVDALKKLAKYNLSRSNAKIIGVTGSVGKTTLKEMLIHVLSNQETLKKEVYASKKNFNSKIGLPICAATMPSSTKISILEMGMSAAGEIKNLIDIAIPEISVITNICETHLEFFESVFDIAKAKSEIFETASPQYAAIIPSDSPYTDFLKNKAFDNGIKNVFSFGFAKNSNIKIESYNLLEECIDVSANFFGAKIDYRLECNNISCVPNSAAAIFAAHIASGISIHKLSEAIRSFSAPSMRGESIYLKEKDILLIDDSYNACPTSMRLAIQSMSKYANRRKIVIIGDMRELGVNAVNFHKNLSPTIDKFGIDLVFACGNLAKHLFDNLIEEKKGGWYENSEQLSKKILEQILQGDCILVKGSRSMKMELVVDAIKNVN